MRRSLQEIRRAAQVFKALSHPQRLQIACLLLDGECPSQKQLIEELGLPQSTVARHLEPLRQTGLVVGVRQGAELKLSAQGEVLSGLLDAMCNWFHEQASTEESPETDAAPRGKLGQGEA